MPLTLWQISLLIDRKQDPICVGSFPRSVAEQLKLRIADVYLSLIPWCTYSRSMQIWRSTIFCMFRFYLNVA